MTGVRADAGARRFLFGDDLRRPKPQPEAPSRDTAAAAALEEAGRAAYARGLSDGRHLAGEETARRLAEAAERIAAEVRAALDALDGRVREIEDEALAFFGALARKLAGGALAEQPLAGVAAAATEAFRHLRGVPHLVVRVHARLVEEADGLVARLARESGFEGRTIVVGDDEIEPGDARLDWADGGVTRDRAAMDAAVSAVIASAGEARTAPEVTW